MTAVTMRTVTQIIDACGGPEAIETASGKRKRPGKREAQPCVSHWAVRKWSKIGIPERNWPLVMRLVPDATPAELYAASNAARAAKVAA